MGNKEELKSYKREKHIQITVTYLCIFFRKIEIKPKALFQSLSKPRNVSLALNAGIG